MIKRQLIYALAAVGALALSQAARADLPVPVEVVGCVKDGEFTSQNFTFSVSVPTEAKKADLSAYEGKTIEIAGYLSPGDRLSIGKVRVVAAGCQKELQRDKLLCDPCITMPDQLRER